MKTKSIYDLKQEYLDLLDALLECDPETGEISEEALSIYERLSGEVEEKITSTGHVMLRLKAEHTMISEEIKRLRLREKRISKGRERLADLLRQLMISTEHQRVVSPTITVSLGAGRPSVQITDIDLLPSWFTKTTIEANKSKLFEVLKKGEHVRGAELKIGNPVLRIY